MKINELKAEIVRNGLTIEEFSDAAGINRTTLWRRLSKPNEFTLSEIKSMSRTLNLNSDKVMDIFFADKVS
ncbi:MAG: helix-turn-helix transcriptional regulator [Desulfitobacteriaceae bacterium]|nr:helix-turn-helix transcriptional regulator [Desulfitobacteriaceae bacterium]